MAGESRACDPKRPGPSLRGPRRGEARAARAGGPGAGAASRAPGSPGGGAAWVCVVVGGSQCAARRGPGGADLTSRAGSGAPGAQDISLKSAGAESGGPSQRAYETARKTHAEEFAVRDEACFGGPDFDVQDHWASSGPPAASGHLRA